MDEKISQTATSCLLGLLLFSNASGFPTAFVAESQTTKQVKISTMFTTTATNNKTYEAALLIDKEKEKEMAKKFNVFENNIKILENDIYFQGGVNHEATIRNALEFLNGIQKLEFIPKKVTQSQDRGIMFQFIENNNYISFEIFQDGECVFLIKDENQKVKAFDTDVTDGLILTKKYLNGIRQVQ